MNPIDYKYAMLISNRIDGFTIKSTNPFKAQMRCPICGDSQKSKSKKRGWFTEYKDGVRFGCFNCGVSLWLGQMLQQLDTGLYDEYTVEGKVEWMKGRESARAPAPAPVRKVFDTKSVLSEMTKVSALPVNHFAKKYVQSRLIPPNQHFRIYFASDFNGMVNKVIPKKLPEKKEPRLVFPLMDRNNKVFGVSGRALSDSSLRYITIMFDEKMPKVYGADVVDPLKKNYVVEGALDSLFLPNCWAMVGADVGLGNKYTTYIHDNEPRNKEIVKRIEKLIKGGKKVCLWPEKMLQYGKDINDYVKAGLSQDQLVEIIDRNTFSGLHAELQLRYWRKC